MNIKVELDIDLWINPKGQVLLYVADSPQEVNPTPLLELLQRSIYSHKAPNDEFLDRDEAKKFVKLKKELVKCLDYINYELDNA